LRAEISAVAPEASIQRTVLRHPAAGWTVETPEHLLASCAAFGLSNLEIVLSASELPILDGSAAPYAEAFERIGLEEQDSAALPAPAWTVREPVAFRHRDAEITALPGVEALTLSYYIDFPETALGTQGYVYMLDSCSFVREIAPARTFVLEADIEKLRARGLIRGGDPRIAVVVGRDRYLNPPLRFPEECIRHKIIDLLGDLVLAGGAPRGHFSANRAGHAAHLAFLDFLRKGQHISWIHPPPQ